MRSQARPHRAKVLLLIPLAARCDRGLRTHVPSTFLEQCAKFAATETASDTKNSGPGSCAPYLTALRA